MIRSMMEPGAISARFILSHRVKILLNSEKR